MPAGIHARRGRTLAVPDTGHRPRMDADHFAVVRSWHECAYGAALEAARGEQHIDYMGLSLVVPPGVAGITPVSHLLGDSVVAEAHPGMHVLDMGTGCGTNALLAAGRGAHVVAVDVSPAAATATRLNADRNGVAHLVDVRVSDVFDAVPERFDLIVFDPPLRWFRPRDAIESSMTDEGYRALERFLRNAPDHLTPAGRILIFFGSAGDIAYLRELFVEFAYETEVVAYGRLFREGVGFDYLTYRAFPGRAPTPSLLLPDGSSQPT